MDDKTGCACLTSGCLVLLLMGCLIFLCIVLGGVLFYSLPDSFDLNVELPVTIRPTDAAPDFRRPEINGVPIQISEETLLRLHEAVVPEADLRELAIALTDATEIPKTVDPGAVNFQVGDQKNFWVTNTDTNKTDQRLAILRYSGPHLAFWIEDGARYDEAALEELAKTFEEDIYPTVREFFGSEWTPGVDGDPRLYVLYTRGMGRGVAGYYSSADQYHPDAHKYSNGHEMFFLSADNVRLHESFTAGVLAHEFQHMIHWYQDANEEEWLNEGFSEVATLLLGYDQGGFEYAYATNPDMPFTSWPGGNADTSAHYGGPFLFLTYFLGRFGTDMTQDLVSQERNGMDSVDAVLAGAAELDLLRGDIPAADDVFQDWTVAAWLKDGAVGDGRYSYAIYPQASRTRVTESFSTCPAEDQLRGVYQYGVDIIQFQCAAGKTIHFEGSTAVGLVPEDAYSGSYMFWSNRVNASSTTLTRSFDFTDHRGSITFSYYTWYEIEDDYDYLYLLASTDGGDTWQIVQTPSGTLDDPSGNSYGWAYNGDSRGWIQERVDLTKFVGQEVLLRFKYVTDAAVVASGFLLDDIAIPEIGYFESFEGGVGGSSGGWDGEGFVLVENILPQKYRLSLVIEGAETEVRYITLSEHNTAEIDVPPGANTVTLIVSGMTRYTQLPSAYRFRVEP